MIKAFLFLLVPVLLVGFGGCVNQSIAARRTDIPWNRPTRGESSAQLPFSMTEQYDD